MEAVIYLFILVGGIGIGAMAMTFLYGGNDRIAILKPGETIVDQKFLLILLNNTSEHLRQQMLTKNLQPKLNKEIRESLGES